MFGKVVSTSGIGVFLNLTGFFVLLSFIHKSK